MRTCLCRSHTLCAPGLWHVVPCSDHSSCIQRPWFTESSGIKGLPAARAWLRPDGGQPLGAGGPHDGLMMWHNPCRTCLQESLPRVCSTVVYVCRTGLRRPLCGLSTRSAGRVYGMRPCDWTAKRWQIHARCLLHVVPYSDSSISSSCLHSSLGTLVSKSCACLCEG